MTHDPNADIGIPTIIQRAIRESPLLPSPPHLADTPPKKRGIDTGSGKPRIVLAGMCGNTLRSSERTAAPGGWDPKARDLLFLLVVVANPRESLLGRDLRIYFPRPELQPVPEIPVRAAIYDRFKDPGVAILNESVL